MDKGYAICFNEWIFDREIKSDLPLLLYISSLCAEKGYSRASNDYLSNKFGIHKINITKKLKKLEKKGYIYIEYKYQGKQIISRILRINKTPLPPLAKTLVPPSKNAKDNNTSINNNSCRYEQESLEIRKKDLQSLFENWNKLKEKDKHWKVCRKITLDISNQYYSIIKNYTKEDVNISITNYIKEIKNRDRGNGYYEHRFSLYEFLKQSNGFKKFLNL